MALLSRRARRVLGFIRPYTGVLVAVLVLMLVGTAMDLALPALLGWAIDTVFLPGGEVGKLRLLVAALVGLSVARSLIAAARGVLQTWAAAHVTYDMRNHLFEHLQQLPLRFFARTRVGDILSRLNGDLNEIQSVATGALVGFIVTVLSLAGTVVLLILISWRLFLIIALVTPVAALLLTRFRSRMQAAARRVREQTAALASMTVESLSGMRFVRALGAEATERHTYRALGRRLIAVLMRLQVISALGGGVPGTVLVLGMAGALYFGGRMVIDGRLTLGALTAFAIYQGRLFGPLQGLMGLYLGIQRARASLDRVFEYLDLEPQTPDRPGAIDPGRLAGRIEFEDVCFTYGEAGQAVLEGASFRIEPGQRVALIGASGAGKSTLVDLLWRFELPQRGRVLIDGHDLRDLALAPLIQQMLVLSQEPHLFHTTLGENVRYGRRDATGAEVARAVRAADLGTLIDALPGGLDTEVGERGVQLSTGQRQRVALARAFLRRPRILVLDEATSSLDWISEDAVQRSLDTLMQGTTTLIITHRVARARDADQVLVLASGCIVERGAPAALAAGNGLYARLLEREQGTAPTALRHRLARGPRVAGSGRGVRVALVDSGVTTPHPHVGRLAAAVTVQRDDAGRTSLVPGCPDRHGHGTATAALLHYLAPEAELVAVKIFERELRTTQEHLQAAIRWSLEQRARVINLSLGTPPGPHASALHATCREAVDCGAILIAATPAALASAPAVFPEVIAVGEDRTLGDDDLRLGAGGAEFLASGHARPRPGSPPDANFMGASFAAARVASLVARLLEQRPEAELEAVRAALRELCTVAGD